MKTLRYVGLSKITEVAGNDIENVLNQFSADCQRMFIWFAGILGSREAIKHHLDQLAEHGKPLSVNTYRPNCKVDSVLASLPVEDIVEAVEKGGEFEMLYAKAFVVFTFQIWEEVTRGKIATILNLDDPKHVKSDLMGDWLLLRNWLVHQNESAESEFLNKSKTLPQLLGIQPGEPNLTAGMVAVLMKQLNRMQVDVSPLGLDFPFELTSANPASLAKVADSIEPNTGLALPTAAMASSSACIVFDDGPNATIHERDCEQAAEQFQNTEGSKQMIVPSIQQAREVIAHMDKQETLCEYCILAAHTPQN
ncbi:MAG: hypothetical protein OXH31_09600 [Gammaproteobacteria bacterium]|nr:hypothetical protein [Gammaproteobacteria bacterium]